MKKMNKLIEKGLPFFLVYIGLNILMEIVNWVTGIEDPVKTLEKKVKELEKKERESLVAGTISSILQTQKEHTSITKNALKKIEEMETLISNNGEAGASLCNIVKEQAEMIGTLSTQIETLSKKVENAHSREIKMGKEIYEIRDKINKE